MAKACSQRSAEKQLFEWTASEVELLLETVKTYAADCMFEGKDWEGVKSKYNKILALYVDRYPKETSEDFPKEMLPDSPFTRDRTATKVKAIRKGYKKAIDTGKKSGGGRIVWSFYDICNEIWGGCPAIQSIDGEQLFCDISTSLQLAMYTIIQSCNIYMHAL